MNIRNHGVAIGRLTRDPKVFDNTDGSKKVMLTLACQDNFKGSDGKRGTQFVPVVAFIPKDKFGLGVYAYMHKGDLVSVEYNVRSGSYEDANKETVYTTELYVQSVDLMENAATTQARAAQAAASAAPAPAAEAPADEADTPFGE